MFSFFSKGNSKETSNCNLTMFEFAHTWEVIKNKETLLLHNERLIQEKQTLHGYYFPIPFIRNVRGTLRKEIKELENKNINIQKELNALNLKKSELETATRICMGDTKMSPRPS